MTYEVYLEYLKEADPDMVDFIKTGYMRGKSYSFAGEYVEEGITYSNYIAKEGEVPHILTISQPHCEVELTLRLLKDLDKTLNN